MKTWIALIALIALAACDVRPNGEFEPTSAAPAPDAGATLEGKADDPLEEPVEEPEPDMEPDAEPEPDMEPVEEPEPDMEPDAEPVEEPECEAPTVNFGGVDPHTPFAALPLTLEDGAPMWHQDEATACATFTVRGTNPTGRIVVWAAAGDEGEPLPQMRVEVRFSFLGSETLVFDVLSMDNRDLDYAGHPLEWSPESLDFNVDEEGKLYRYDNNDVRRDFLWPERLDVTVCRTSTDSTTPIILGEVEAINFCE